MYCISGAYFVGIVGEKGDPGPIKLGIFSTGGKGILSQIQITYKGSHIVEFTLGDRVLVTGEDRAKFSKSEYFYRAGARSSRGAKILIKFEHSQGRRIRITKGNSLGKGG